MSRLTNMIAALGFSMCGLLPAAADPVVVVELYTSQGCSSCPPADEILTELATRDDVIALALHVDYWDYIGWKDDFANPAFTQRQKHYAHVAGSRSIYTPQFIVQGRDHVVGYRPMELAAQISAHVAAQNSNGVDLTMTQAAGKLTVAPSGLVPVGAVLQVVTIVPERTVSIGRGENTGKTITYSNIVTSWRQVGDWSGQPVSLSVSTAEDEQVIAILQQKNAGPILAAARLR